MAILQPKPQSATGVSQRPHLGTRGTSKCWVHDKIMMVEVVGITVTISCLQLQRTKPCIKQFTSTQLMPLSRERGTVISILQMKVSYW